MWLSAAASALLLSLSARPDCASAFVGQSSPAVAVRRSGRHYHGASSFSTALPAAAASNDDVDEDEDEGDFMAVVIKSNARFVVSISAQSTYLKAIS